MTKTLKLYAMIMTVMFFSVTVSAEEPAVVPAPEKTVPAAAAPVVAAPAKPLGDMDQLKEQIKKLEDKLTKMEEENEIRRRLETTEEEKKADDEAILTAAGRDYTLMKPGSLGFEYSFRYAGDSFDSVQVADGKVQDVRHNAYHTVTNSLFIEYPVKDNLTMSSNIPFVYKMNSQTNSSTAKDVSDFGDVSFGFQHQPFKSGGDMPPVIVTGTLTCPTGRSPYKIDPTREISTGNGVYSVGVGCNVSKSIDPIVAFGGFNVEHGIETSHLSYKSAPTQGEDGAAYMTGVKPGDTYSISMGIGYSMSYKTSLTLSYQYSYQSSTRYYMTNGNFKSDGSISSVFSVGTGWTLTPKNSVNIRLGIGLTNNDSDFSLQVLVPLTYEL